MFVVLDCLGTVPITAGLTNNTGGLITSPNSIDVCDGEAFCVDVVFTDADPGTVLQVISNALALLPGATFTVTGNNPAIATLCWTGDVTNSPVNVLVTADDGNCPVENTASTSILITSSGPGGPAPDPGTNGAISLCANAIPTDLFAELGGTPDPLGFWSDPLGNWHSGLFDPATDPAGTYTYTVGNSCWNLSAQVTVTIVPSPSAGTNGTLSICSNSAAVNMFGSLGGTPQVGGMWTAPGGAAHGTNYDPAIDGPGVYVYTIAGGPGCGSSSATVTVTEVAAPNAGTNGTLSICSTSGVVSLLTYLGGTPAAGGTWTAPGGGASGGNYNPAVHNPGVYTYTVNGTAPCPNAIATVTVTENTPPSAGTNGTLSICSTNAATGLFGSLGGTPALGGTWTAPGGGAFSGTYDPVVNVSGVYTYTVAGIPPCPNASATITVTESSAPNAGANGTLSLCSTDAAVSLFAYLGGTPAGGGTWTAPGGGAFGGSYNPAVHNPGVYTYTVPGIAPCPSASATVTVTENLAPSAGTNGNLSLCSSSAATGLFASLGGAPAAGGTWTAPGGGAFSGTYDPAVDAPGIYTYTVAGVAPCPGASATVTVTENLAPSGGTNGNLSLCSSSAATGLFASLGGTPAIGGTWTAPGGGAFSGTYDPAVDAPGIYTYTVAGVAPCPGASATVTVTENLAPSAGTNGNLSLCSSSAATGLFASLGGAPAAGGTWTAPGGGAFSGTYDPAVDAPGIYTYTVAGVAPCPGASATVTVTENLAPSGGTNGNLSLCSSSAATGLFASLGGTPAIGGTWTAPGGGAFSGTYDPAVDAPGIYTYTVAGVAPCLGASATVTVTENLAPSAGTNGNLSLCSSSAATGLFASLGGAPAAGGTWTAPGGGAFSGTYDPAVDAPGIYTYTVAGVAPCPGASATVTVTENLAPSAGTNGNLSLCSSSAATGLFASLGGAPAAGGTWTAPGGGAFSGTYDPALDAPGIYTYTVAGVAPCLGASATVTVGVNPSPDAGVDGATTLCDVGAPQGLFGSIGGTPDAGGTWTAPGGGAFSGTYDPALDAPGIYTYTVAGMAPCLGASATVTVGVNPSPDAGVDGATTLCDVGAPQGLFGSIGGTPDAGGTWTAPGGGAFSGTYDPALDAPGTYTYTVTGVAPCLGASATVTVTENLAPSAGTNGNLSLCSSSAATGLFASLGGAPAAGGTWTAPGGGAFSGTYGPALDAPGIYTYTVAGVAPCPGASATVTVTENLAPSGGTNGNLSLCSSSAATGLFASLGGTPAIGGTWTAPGGGAFSGTYSVRCGGCTGHLHIHCRWRGALSWCKRDGDGDGEPRAECRHERQPVVVFEQCGHRALRFARRNTCNRWHMDGARRRCLQWDL